MGTLLDGHRWVEQYYRIKWARVERVRAHWWPRLPSGVIRRDHKIKEPDAS